MVFLARSFPAAVIFILGSLCLPASASGQQLMTGELGSAELIHVGTWDGATGQRVGDAANSTFGGAPAPVLVYDNSNTQSFISFGRIVILLDYGILSAGGNNTISRISIGYASCAKTTDVVLRLHRGVNPGEALNPKELPGKGLSIPLYDLPGDDVDCATATTLIGRVVEVLLPYPIPLDDGAIRYGLQYFDEQTFVLQVKPNPALGINSKLQGYNADTGAAYLQAGGLPYSGSNASLFIQLWGVDSEFDSSTGSDRDLVGRDSHMGAIEPAGDLDIFRYEALAGEQFSVNLAGKGKNGLSPVLDLVDLTTGLSVATAGDGSNKARLKRVALPTSGAYELRVAGTGDESTGIYAMKVGVKASPLAKQVTVPEAPGSVLAAFVAKPGTTLTALVKPSVKTDAAVALPVLEGPLGAIDLAPWATLKGANTWRIKNMPLPLFGAYELKQATEEGEAVVDLVAKARIKAPRVKGGRSDELSDALDGAWIQREFVTKATSFRMSLGASEGGGDRFERVETTNSISAKTITPISTWKVLPAELPDMPGALTLSYQITSTKQLIKPYSENGLNDTESVSSGSTLSFKDVFEFKDGNPNVIEFPFFDVSANGDKVWYREVSTSLTPPAFGIALLPAPGDGGGQVVLSIECQEGAVGYEVFKTPNGTQVTPAFPLTRISPPCQAVGGPADPDLAYWIDTGSSADPTGYEYWVAAMGPDGRRSVLAGPLSLD